MSHWEGKPLDDGKGPAGANCGLERPAGHVLHSDREPAARINISRPRHPCLYPYINSCYSLLQPHKRHGEKWTHVPLAAELGACRGRKGCSTGWNNSTGQRYLAAPLLLSPSPQPFSSNIRPCQGRRASLLGALLRIVSLGGLLTHLLIIHSLAEICFHPGDSDGGNRWDRKEVAFVQRRKDNSLCK